VDIFYDQIKLNLKMLLVCRSAQNVWTDQISLWSSETRFYWICVICIKFVATTLNFIYSMLWSLFGCILCT